MFVTGGQSTGFTMLHKTEGHIINQRDEDNIMEPLKVKETGLAEGIPSIKHANKVEHPSHYADGRKYEPINVICDWNLDFCLGNVVKYISRAGRKENEIEDLKKARFYLDYKIKGMEEN